MYICTYNIYVYIYIYIYICMYICIYIYIYNHIVKLPYDLRSRVVCHSKIKPNPRLLGFCYILCCACMMLPFKTIYI